MSSKINLQTCEYARKSSIFQDNQLIFIKSQGIFDTYLFGLLMVCWIEFLLLMEKPEISRIFGKD